MHSRRRIVFLLIIALTAVMAPGADEPPWILLERGKASYEERDLTRAMDILLDAVEADVEYPEAEFWLGRVYEAQGQAELAEEQYRKALDLAIYLRVPDDDVEYRYALAGLLLDQGQDRRLDAEAVLADIADQEGASRRDSIALDHRYIATITEQGIDELLYLYRDELGYSLKARRLLGEQAWNDGRYRTALLQSTRVVLSLLTSASGALRTRTSGWRFDIDPVEDALQPDRDVRYPGPSDGVDDLLTDIGRSMPDMARWLDEQGLWPQLYLLGAALFAEGHTESARTVWTLLTVTDSLTGLPGPREQAGKWGRLALRQLEEPFISTGSLAP